MIPEDVSGQPVGSQDLSQVSPAEARLELRASLPRHLECRDYLKSEVANDPFQLGAVGAIDCDRTEEAGFAEVNYMTLFRFRSSQTLSAYWRSRVDQNPQMTTRERACADGKKGYGAWIHGEYFCYVSPLTARALLRWTDERTNTYGVMDANDTRIGPLYRAWQRLRP